MSGPGRPRGSWARLTTAAARRLVFDVIGGREPAEALPTDQRAQLVAELVRSGWSDLEIATRLLMSTYTTARIRSALQLPPNRPWRTA